MRGRLKGKVNKAMLLSGTVFFVLSNFYFLTLSGVPDAGAQVQVVLDPTQASIQIPWKAVETARFSKEEILNDLKATFFKNVVANLARTFAKSFATYIVTGSKGGKPFWETNIWESIKDQGQAAFEDWLTAAISSGIGLDLCKFDPTLTLNIALSLPNKTDILPLGEMEFGGCSFEELKDRYSTDGKEWQDFVKIKVTEIGPDFRKSIDQLRFDIDHNRNLRQNNAGVPFFTNPPRVLADLTQKTIDLGDMREKLDADITKLLDKRGTRETVKLSVGDYAVAPEYINDIKAAWKKKLDAGRSEANTQKSAYHSCNNKTLVTIRVELCATKLEELGYEPVPGQTWVDLNNIYSDQTNKAQYFLREAQDKMETASKLYNTLANGYEGLYKYVNNQLKPEMFESGGLYTFQKAKTQFQPKADPVFETGKQLEAGSSKAKAEAEERQSTTVATTGGWKNSVDKISGYIKTPAELLKARTIEAVAADPRSTAGDYTRSIVADSLGVFLQELYNLYIQQLLMALSNPKKQKEKSDGNIHSAEKQSVVTEAGVNLYYDSIDPGFAANLPELDLLQEFQTTIAGKKMNPNIYNNVIDVNFAMAIEQRMTISEAMAEPHPKLNGALKFGWTETLSPNTFNISNIRKLRKARVVPLGLELAAELIRDCNYRNILDSDGDGTPNFDKFQDLAPNGSIDVSKYDDLSNYDRQRLDNCLFKTGSANSALLNIYLMSKTLNATLLDVKDGFDDRGADGICGVYGNDETDTESPFCNLVDPGWVLKIPATKCLQSAENESYGEILQDNESGTRYSRCADFVSCLKGDNKNSCASSAYGVCVKEKNVWSLNAESCPPQYDSCRAYTMKDSRGKKSDVAFLKNTLDSSGCSEDTVGCKGYRRSYDNNPFYFNSNVDSCEDKEEGCHEFITDPITLNTLIEEATLPNVYDDNVLATRVYYKINPACDIDPTGPNCASFMSKCTDAQVGCASYRPLSNEPAVAAVLKEDDQCPAECNGFSAFFRQPTSFEPVSQIAFFVANTAQTCNAASAGCSEFTNLEKINSGVPVAEALEYYTSLRHCIKPGSNLNEKTFFTWQSIASGPQQVIKHVLQSITAADLANYPEDIGVIGAPATYDYSGDCQLDLTAVNYCLKFYDSTGATFYRDIRKTILVSDKYCYPVRKTVSNQAVCTQTLGTWADNYCTYNAYAPTGADANVGFGEKSQTCSKAEVNCYNYLAASGNNVYTVFYDDFDAQTIPLEYNTGGDPTNSESVSELGRSLPVAVGASVSRSVEISAGKYYVLGFLAKDACVDAAGNATAPGAIDIAGFGRMNLSCTWGMYELGPIKIDSTINSLVIDNLTGNAIYIDNLNLVQYKANYYLIENSWQQVGCGLDDLNCEAYAGPNNQTFYIRQFSYLCPESKVGCQHLLDTQNSLRPQARDFSGVIVPADNLVSYVVNKDFKCTLAAKGCEKFVETIIQANSGVMYDNVILKNDPDVYAGVGGILCTAEAEGCTELKNEGGYPEYYKINPLKLCYYTHNLISGVGEDIYGWYLAGTPKITGCNTVMYNNFSGCVAKGGTWDPVTATCDYLEYNEVDCEDSDGIWDATYGTCSKSKDSLACEAVANSGIWLDEYDQCVKQITVLYNNLSGCEANEGVWNPIAATCGYNKTDCEDSGGTWDDTYGTCSYNKIDCEDSDGIWDDTYGTCSNAFEYNDSLACVANLGAWLADYELCVKQIASPKDCENENGLWLKNLTKCVVNPFGIFKVSEVGKYDGSTGTCPLNAGNCTGLATVNQDNVTYGQTYYVIDNKNEEKINRSACAATDWNLGCVSFKNTVTGSMETIRAQKDRDCAEWVDCAEKDIQGNCIKMKAYYIDADGTDKVSKEIIADTYCAKQKKADCENREAVKVYCTLTAAGVCEFKSTMKKSINVFSEINPKVNDKVRYDNDTALIINREHYIQRFDNSAERWDAGDYSGYTIPDRYPLETELAKEFEIYSYDTNAIEDERFTAPVCKIFAAENAPLPREIIYKSGYNKITNIYSQSVSYKEVADGCNYDQVESLGVTTYFPFGFLSSTLSGGKVKICTDAKSVAGKLCEGKEKDEKNQFCKVAGENTYGVCRSIESTQTNFGLQSRCLESDILNPLYGNIKQGSYACLSYFPYQYDECAGAGTDSVACSRLPYCSFINGNCVGDICEFHKTKDNCEFEIIEDGDYFGEDIPRCIWDGAEERCLLRKCTLSKVSNPQACANVARYCRWYGDRCIEDICHPDYSGLNGNLDSHKWPNASYCMNPADTSAFTSSSSPFYDLNLEYNQRVTGKGDYCDWIMKGPQEKGRYEWNCQLECGLKYPSLYRTKDEIEPTVDTVDYKDSCNADPYCEWTSKSCRDYCTGKGTDSCLSDAKCGLDNNGQCTDRCKSYNENLDTVEQKCKPDTANKCDLKETCLDACSLNGNENSCEALQDSSKTSLCHWTGSACVDLCHTNLNDTTCTSFRYPAGNTVNVCSWNSTTSICERNDTYSCSNKGTASSCAATMACLWDQKCYSTIYESAPGVEVVGSCSKLDPDDCKLDPDCSLSFGDCVTKHDTYGCELWKYSAQANKNADNNKKIGMPCLNKTRPGTDIQACDWAYRDYAPYFNFCFPRDNKPYDGVGYDTEFTCHLCRPDRYTYTDPESGMTNKTTDNKCRGDMCTDLPTD